MTALGIFSRVVIKSIHISLYKMVKGPNFAQPTTKIIHINLCIIVQNAFIFTTNIYDYCLYANLFSNTFFTHIQREKLFGRVVKN